MAVSNDISFMQRCLQLAKLGMGNVAPNPLVGCVIVYNHQIIGEGYHKEFGHAHAEVNAINSVANKKLLSESTLYVNLEPCAHYGKTPPCANYIIQHKIKRVVIGCSDIFSQVNGAGIQLLSNAGIEVSVGVLENECLQLNKRFFTYHSKKRPYIILKWAQSANGIIGNSNVPNLKISNTLSKSFSHLKRSQEQAILVGSKTVLCDNPSLTTRFVFGKNPLRIVIDLTNKIPTFSKVLGDENPTILFSNKTKTIKNNKYFIEIENQHEGVNEVIKKLYGLNIQSVIIEGGARTIQQFIDSDMWDEALVFVSNENIEGDILAPSLTNKNFNSEISFNSKKVTCNRLLIYTRTDVTV